jgi:hypothetical protein
MLTPGFKAARFEVEEANYYPIKCSWIYHQVGKEALNIHQEQNAIVFPKGCPKPSTQVIRITRDDPKIEFNLTYDPQMPGRENELDKLIVYPKKSIAPYFILNIRVSIDNNGIVSFDQGQTLEEYSEVPNEVLLF